MSEHSKARYSSWEIHGNPASESRPLRCLVWTGRTRLRFVGVFSICYNIRPRLMRPSGRMTLWICGDMFWGNVLGMYELYKGNREPYETIIYSVVRL